MNQKDPDLQAKGPIWYKRLDKFLLILMTSELGYFMLLIFFGVIYAITRLFITFDISLWRFNTGILWPVLFFIIALPLNIIGGFIGLVLNIVTKHKGYPGTGHMLNWIFLMTTGWLFILALVFTLPSMTGAY
jgi:hypothetical protein